MRGPELTPKRRIEIDGVEGFFVGEVSKIGNGAKINCPKRYLGRTVYVVVV